MHYHAQPPPPMFCFVFKKEFFQNSCFMCMGVLYAYLGKPEEGTRPSRIKVRDYCEPLWVLGSGLRSSGRAAFPAEPSPQPRPHLRKSLNVYICWEQTCQTLWVRGQLWGVPPPLRARWLWELELVSCSQAPHRVSHSRDGNATEEK